MRWFGELAGPSLHLPRHLVAGPLLLDLFHRDARARERWLHLNPREFAVLWLLAEAAPVPVTQAQLLRDAWRLDFHPETNRVAVVVCRVRAKLLAVGVSGLIETTPEGAYRLGPSHEALDSRQRVGDDAAVHGSTGEGNAVSRQRAGIDRSG